MDTSLKPLVRVIDDDDAVRRSWAFLIEGEGWDVVTYSDALDFIASNDFQRPGCLVLDVRMPRMSGLELQDKLLEIGVDLPIIFIHGKDDHFVPTYMSERMYEACRSPKELHLIENCGHSAAYMCAKEEYTEAVNRLLDGRVK